MYDENQSEFQRRVKVVLLPGADDTDIPADLRRATRYRVSDFTPDRMGDLPRVLHRSPRHVMPPLGPKPDLPPDVGERPDRGGGWRPLTAPLPPASTPLDGDRDQSIAPTLELRLLREGASSLAMADLRALAEEFGRVLREAKPSVVVHPGSAQW